MMNNYCKDPETWDSYRGVRPTSKVAKTNAASTPQQQGNNSNQRKRKADNKHRRSTMWGEFQGIRPI
jgi:hypothetical protein